MQIRVEQIESLISAQQEGYERRLLAFFRGAVPKATAEFTEAALLEVIREGLRKARRYGIESGPSVARFIGLMLLLSPHFDEEPAVQRFLALPDLDPNLRIKTLSDLLAQTLRAGEG